jgi:predicted transcriptional regulator
MLAMSRKPQVSVETTVEFADEFSKFAETQRTKKRHLVEDALKNYMSEFRGVRLAVDVDPDLKRRLEHASTNEGLRLDWLVVRAIDDFLKTRESGDAARMLAEISMRLATKLDVFRHVRGTAEVHVLLEQAVDQMIERDLRYDDNARARFDGLLGQVFKNDEN